MEQILYLFPSFLKETKNLLAEDNSEGAFLKCLKRMQVWFWIVLNAACMPDTTAFSTNVINMQNVWRCKKQNSQGSMVKWGNLGRLYEQ